jgi:hypothetical protein
MFFNIFITPFLYNNTNCSIQFSHEEEVVQLEQDYEHRFNQIVDLHLKRDPRAK